MKLTDKQDNALLELIGFAMGDTDRFCLTGVSGSGKTEVISEFVKTLPSIQSMQQLVAGSELNADVILTATTNKAANVLYERTGLFCKTIHSLLGLQQKINYQNGNISYIPSRNSKRTKKKIVIIDEASMIDKALLGYIDKYLGESKVIYVLDKYQATPVKCSYVPVMSQGYKEVHLDEPVRYDKDSHLAYVSRELRKYIDGQRLDLPVLNDNKTVLTCRGEEFQKLINSCIGNPKYVEENGKILVWTNDKAHAYNNYCRSLHHQESFYNPGEILILRKPVVQNNTVIYPNERHITIQSVDTTVHTYEDVDYYEIVTTDLKTLQVPVNLFQYAAVLKSHKNGANWITYYELVDKFIDARPVYASTIHCSQGSTFEDVFIDIGDLRANRNNVEVARLLYVAMTRAKGKVYLYGYKQ